MKNSFTKVCFYDIEHNTEICSEVIRLEGNRITAKGRNLKLLPHQSIVDVVGYSDDGLVFMKAHVTLSNESQINLEIIGMEKHDRRQYLKVRSYLDTKVIRALSLGKRKKSYLINEHIKTRDLSLGGIAFYANNVYLLNQKIELDLGNIKPGFKVMAKVLRRQNGLYPGGYRYKYACSLIDVEGHKERILCEFVFKTQLEDNGR